MKNYNFTDIVEVTSKGILFTDNYFVDFNKCRIEWAKENKISESETVCVAERYYSINDCYFILYDTEKVKISFIYKGLFKKKRTSNKFVEFQMKLNQVGYTSYDKT